MRTGKMARYKIVSRDGGVCLRFFCDVSGAAVFTTAPIMEDKVADALEAAWTEGKKHLNRCGRCGRLVCDTMYNADVCECVECSPWEAEANYCKECGMEILKNSVFCSKCGARAKYGEVWNR